MRESRLIAINGGERNSTAADASAVYQINRGQTSIRLSTECLYMRCENDGFQVGEPRALFGCLAKGNKCCPLLFRGGRESPISFPQLATLLSSTKERLFADFATHRFVSFYRYVHRVEGLPPGVYRFWPEHAELEKIEAGTNAW